MADNPKSDQSKDVEKNKTFSLAEIALDESACRDDFALTDRYQAFSSEMLRVALLALAVCGFLLKEVYLAPGGSSFVALGVFGSSSFQIGVLSMAIAAGYALAHRYYSSDCMAYHVAYLRLKTKRDLAENAKEKARFNSRMASQKNLYGSSLKLCSRLLLSAAWALAIGIVSLALTFAQTLMNLATGS